MKIWEKGRLPFDEEGIAQHIKAALAVEPPSGAALQALRKLLQLVFRPELIDTGNIPDKPCLFVGNHSLFALDALVLAPLLLTDTGHFVRSVSDRFLWTEVTEKALLQTGSVLGQPQVFDALMEAGQDLLLFPGGANEALKPKSQQYTLQWKQRYGFVRQAATRGYTIVPVAIVGPEEFYGHLLEGEQILDSPVGELLRRCGLITERTRRDMIPPLPLGLAGSLLPKPQRCYFQFGKAVDLSSYAGKTLSTRQLHTIRTRVATRIESMLEELVPRSTAYKAGDGFLRRLLTR